MMPIISRTVQEDAAEFLHDSIPSTLDIENSMRWLGWRELCLDRWLVEPCESWRHDWTRRGVFVRVGILKPETG